MTDSAALADTAGYVDGEGCFTINKNGSITLGIVNTSKITLEYPNTRR